MSALPTEHRTGIFAAGLLAVSLLWAGMILGVSFLATPVKFLAPSLTLPVALDVGRHTFAVFNWVEIGWGLALVGLLLLRPAVRWVYAMAAVPCLIVALTSVWLLPVLDARTRVIIAGGTPPGSDLHLLYIVLEFVKLAALLALAVWSLCYLAGRARPRSAAPETPDDRGPARPSEPLASPRSAARVLPLDERRRRQSARRS